MLKKKIILFLRENIGAIISIVSANLSLIIGLQYYHWGYAETMLLLICEGILADIFLFIQNLTVRPQMARKIRLNDYLSWRILSFIFFDGVFIFLAIALYFRHSMMMLTWQSFQLLAVPLFFLLAGFCANIAHLWRHKQKYFRAAGYFYHWLWQIYLPIFFCVFLLFYHQQFFKVVIALAAIKIIAAVYYEYHNFLQYHQQDFAVQEKIGENIIKIGPHPFSTYAIIRIVFVYMILIALFAGMREIPKQIILYIIIIGILGALPILLRQKHYLTYDKQSGILTLRKKIIFWQETSIAIKDVKRILTKKNEDNIITAYTLETAQNKNIKISAGYFSSAELCGLLGAIKKQHPYFNAPLDALHLN